MSRDAIPKMLLDFCEAGAIHLCLPPPPKIKTKTSNEEWLRHYSFI